MARFPDRNSCLESQWARQSRACLGWPGDGLPWLSSSSYCVDQGTPLLPTPGWSWMLRHTGLWTEKLLMGAHVGSSQTRIGCVAKHWPPTCLRGLGLTAGDGSWGRWSCTLFWHLLTG